MRKRHLLRITALATISVWLWIAVNVLLSTFGNGLFYHASQPAPVIDVVDGRVTLEYNRYSWLDMEGTCTNELQCSNILIEYGSQPCPLERGDKTFQIMRPLVDIVEGPCFVRGTVAYQPLGKWGPRMVYLWESEEFELP